MVNRFYLTHNETLLGTTTQSYCSAWSNSYKGFSHIPQSSRTEVSPLDAINLIFRTLHECTQCIQQPQPTGLHLQRLRYFWFGLVSLFNGISTFVVYLMPNPFS